MRNDKMLQKTAIAFIDDMKIKAADLARELNLPLTSPDNKDYRFLLFTTKDRIELHDTSENNAHPLYVDFLSSQTNASQSDWH